VNPGLRRLGCDKEHRTLRYLGAESFDAVVEHIEAKMDNYNSQHQGGTQMSFMNIELDHIKPVQRFALEMSHYTNMQPMLREANRGKGARWTDADETFWRAHIQQDAGFTDIYTHTMPDCAQALGGLERSSCAQGRPTVAMEKETDVARFAGIVERGDKNDVVFYKEIRAAAVDAGLGILPDARIDGLVWMLYALRPNKPSKLVDGRMKQDRGYKYLRFCAAGDARPLLQLPCSPQRLPTARTPLPTEDSPLRPFPPVARERANAGGVMPWQRAILDRLGICEQGGVVHVVVDKRGTAHSTSNRALMKIFAQHTGVQKIPVLMDSAAKIMRWCMSVPRAQCYLVDMSRTPKRSALRQICMAVEELRSGYMCSLTGKGTEIYFDEPSVVLFARSAPARKYMREGGWKVWTVADDLTLVACEH